MLFSDVVVLYLLLKISFNFRSHFFLSINFGTVVTGVIKKSALFFDSARTFLRVSEACTADA